MKQNNINEELFDALFREDLSNASSNVPPGVWEGISSSLATSAAASTAAGGLIWLKVSIAVVAVSTAAYFTVDAFQDQGETKTATQAELPVSPADKAEDNLEEPNETPLVRSEQEGLALDKQIVEAPKNRAEEKPEKGPKEAIHPGNPLPQIESPRMPVFILPKSVFQKPVLKDSSKTAEAKTTEDPAPAVQKEAEPQEAHFTYVNDSSEIFIPNTVTPNGDGANDSYLIHLVGEEKVEIIIYNIEDMKVLFRTQNKYEAWNCKMPNGEAAPAGSYIVKVIYKFKGKPEVREVIKLTLIK